MEGTRWGKREGDLEMSEVVHCPLSCSCSTDLSCHSAEDLTKRKKEGKKDGGTIGKSDRTAKTDMKKNEGGREQTQANGYRMK